MRSLTPIALVLGLSIATSAWAADATIKYRQNQMAAMGGHMGSIAALVKGEVDFTDQLAGHAQALATTATFTEAVFKEQAESSKSAAKSNIWTDWDRFAANANELKEASEKLAQAASDNDQRGVRRHVAAVGQACKSCHDRFKEDQ